MSKQLTVNVRESIMATKLEYDSLNQAIRLAKSMGIEDSLVKALVVMKEEFKAMRVANNARLLKSMNLATNVINILGPWYAIRFSNEKSDITISMEILNEHDVPILQRDGRSERELSQKELNTLVPGCIDEVALEMYKRQVVAKAHEHIQNYCGITLEPVEQVEAGEVIRPLTVSSHAGKRYVQRVLGIGAINDVVAEDYRRSHAKEIESAILEGYNSADVVWIAEDGIEFRFDENNIMYVMGSDGGYNNIITLYEEDFGFSKDINRSITLQQLEVLAKARESLWESEKEQEELLKGTDDAIREIADKVAILHAQIELLHAEKATHMTVKDQCSKAKRVARSTYTAEFNKLFKKWDS